MHPRDARQAIGPEAGLEPVIACHACTVNMDGRVVGSRRARALPTIPPAHIRQRTVVRWGSDDRLRLITANVEKRTRGAGR